MILYISSHLFLCQKALQMSISKKRKSWKSLASKTSLTRKRCSKMYSKCMMPKPKPKAYSSKQYKKLHGIAAKKLSCIEQKVWKVEAKWKAFNQCKHIGGGSYMFISNSDVGHLTSCASCVRLDWIDNLNFILEYELDHTWFTHTTHKSNVQWMLISFVWLYVFKCDMCILNCLMIKPKKIVEYFICFWKCFCVSLLFWNFESFSKKPNLFCWKLL